MADTINKSSGQRKAGSGKPSDSLNILCFGFVIMVSLNPGQSVFFLFCETPVLGTVGSCFLIDTAAEDEGDGLVPLKRFNHRPKAVLSLRFI